MKLNKVISLMLGGVMALSMLAGCSSSGSEETGTLVETPTSNTTVVAEVVARMTEDNVGKLQANTTLTGNESADLATAVKAWKNDKVSEYSYDTTAKELLNSNNVGFNSEALSKASTTTVIKVKKADGITDSDIGQAIFTEIQHSSLDTNMYRVAKLSVFDATVVTTTTSNTSTTISGTSANAGSTTAEYWVIVITSASNSTPSYDDGTY